MPSPQPEPARVRAARASVLLMTSVLLAAACSNDSDSDVRSGNDNAVPVGGGVNAGSDSARAAGAVCLAGEPFVGDGTIPVRAATPPDAHQVGALRWEQHQGCERLVIDLVTADRTPADRAGTVTASVLRRLGVVRISLHDIEGVDTDATDAVFGGALADAVFTVRSAAGSWIDVDVHLADAALAHVSTLDSPARVVVDLKPGGATLPEPAPRSNLVVVLQPRSDAATYPLTVSGYARTFEANVVARIEQDGRIVDERFTTSTGWVDAWGAWSFEIEAGPTGAIVLHVGEYSARDGEWQGVAIPLEMRP
jgi:hypothetical protein